MSDQMIKDAELGRLVRLLPEHYGLVHAGGEWRVYTTGRGLIENLSGLLFWADAPEDALRFIWELEKDSKTIEEANI